MSKQKNYIILFLLSILLTNTIYAQEEKKDLGHVSGSFQIDMQSYQEDTIIGIKKENVPAEKMLANAFANINYTKGNFAAGVRYDAYLNTLKGYNSKNDGQGIGFRYASYKVDNLEVTVGNFYEQFGSGLILRTYEDKTLDYDNAFDGIRLKSDIIRGVTLKGLLAKQKIHFDQGEGIVRAIDGEVSINELIQSFSEAKTRFLFGGSFVSKYQASNDPTYNLPQNVGAYAGRFTLSRSGFSLSSEYVQKSNDPSYDNETIFKDGNALYINTSYSMKGFGINLSALRLDNMSFRSDRNATINDLNINYLPSIAKTHAYSLLAMYPFSSQPQGQAGFNAEVFYKLPKESLLGGKYGTDITVNFSQINSIDKQKITIDPSAENPNLDGYTSDFFTIGDSLFYKDFNVEIQKKINKSLKFTLIYMHEDYNKDVIQGGVTYGMVKSDIGVLDVTYKLSSKHAIRIETEALFTEDDYGNWAMGLLEYTISPNWFFGVQDMYNYGNPSKDHQVHYYNFSAGFTKGANRFTIGYGRQREGIMCVGGVCRNVPAASGFRFSVSSTF